MSTLEREIRAVPQIYATFCRLQGLPERAGRLPASTSRPSGPRRVDLAVKLGSGDRTGKNRRTTKQAIDADAPGDEASFRTAVASGGATAMLPGTELCHADDVHALETGLAPIDVTYERGPRS